MESCIIHGRERNKMLITFKHLGCKSCPFFVEGSDDGCLYTWAPKQCTLSNFNNEVRNLIPNRDKKPKDCPFREYPGSIEISAERNE